MRRALRLLALLAILAACSSSSIAYKAPPPSPSPLPTNYGWSTPISTIVVDDFASGGLLTVPPGTQFGIELSGGGWTINLPESYEPYKLVSGPGDWSPDLGFAGAGNCDSASPCGGIGAVFAATEEGYGDVMAWSPGWFAFDLRVQVKKGPIILDLPAVPIINEALSTLVTAPVGSTVNVHATGNWGPPQINSDVLKLFRDDAHMSTTGVVSLTATGAALDEAIYSFQITGRGGAAYQFEHRDPSIYAGYYEIDFDIR